MYIHVSDAFRYFTIENILGKLKFHCLRKFVDFEDNPVSVIRLDLLFREKLKMFKGKVKLHEIFGL